MQVQDLNCTHQRRYACLPPDNLSKTLPFLYRFGRNCAKAESFVPVGVNSVSPLRVRSLENQAFSRPPARGFFLVVRALIFICDASFVW